MALNELYFYREGDYQTLSHSLRVFVCGVDVSSWLRGSLSVTYGDRESFNSCSFEVSNPRRLWQITRENLEGRWQIGGGEYSEALKREVFIYKNDLRRNPFFKMNVEAQELGLVDLQRPSLGSTLPEGAILNRDAALYPQNAGEERRWRLSTLDCIFNKHDFVRIFAKNPYTNSDEQWMEMFCGFIQDISISNNFNTGESSIRFSTSCIKQQLQKMRVSTSPYAEAINQDPTPLFLSGFYQDFLTPGAGSQPFAVASLETTVKSLILGLGQVSDDFGNKDAPNNQKGIGGFKLGNVVCYDPATPGDLLERWHLMTLFGVNKVPFPKGGNQDNLWLTTSEVNKIGAATRTDKNLPVGGPDARYLHLLLPSTGTGPGSLISHDTIEGAAPTTREYSTRWDIIRDFASRVDYQVTTTPSGDIVVEFPQYGFTPEIYSGRAKDADPLPDNQGSLSRIFIFDRHVKEETIQDEGEDFPTILQASGGYVQNVVQNAANNSSIAGVNLRAFVYSPTLISRYGVITQLADFPFVGQNSSDIQGAAAKRLGLLALVEYTKRVANSSSWNGSLVYRPFILPNRPIHFMKSARMATIKTVTHTWNIGQTASTAIACSMLMAERWDGNKSDFRLMTGSANTPLDAGSVWAQAADGSRIQNPDSGVRVSVSEKPATQPTPQGTPNGVAPAPQGGAPVPGGRKGGGADLDLLYPPFKKMVEDWFEKCRQLGVDIRATSTWRSGQSQANIDPKANKTNVAEAFLSYHQYGLAVDVACFRNGSYVENYHDPIYAYVNEVQEKQLRFGFTWGGNFPLAGKNKYRDTIHFQIPLKWGVTSADALIVRQGEVGKPEAQAIKAVWDYIDTRNPYLKDPNTSNIPKIDPNLVAVSASPSAIDKAKKRGGKINTTPVSQKQSNALDAATNQANAQSANAAASQPVGIPAASQVFEIPQSESCVKNELTTPGLTSS